jgi:hypothetical protein
LQRKIWINGDYINWEDAQVHILSHSHQRGSLIFGFIPIFENDGVISSFVLKIMLRGFLHHVQAAQEFLLIIHHKIFN